MFTLTVLDWTLPTLCELWITQFLLIFPFCKCCNTIQYIRPGIQINCIYEHTRCSHSRAVSSQVKLNSAIFSEFFLASLGRMTSCRYANLLKGTSRKHSSKPLPRCIRVWRTNFKITTLCEISNVWIFSLRVCTYLRLFKIHQESCKLTWNCMESPRMEATPMPLFDPVTMPTRGGLAPKATAK